MMEECNKGTEDAGLTPEQLAIKLRRKEKNQKKKEKKRLEKQLEEERKKLELMRAPKDTRVKIITRDFADKLTAPLQSDTSGWKTVTLTPTDFPSLDEIRNKPASTNFAADVNCNSESARDAIESSVCMATELEESKLNGKDVCNPSEANKLCIPKQNNEPKSKKVNLGPVTVNIVDAINKNKRSPRGMRGKNKREILVTGPYGDAVITVRRTRERKKKKVQLNGNSLDSSQPERNKGKHREVPIEKKPTKLKQMILKDLETMRSVQDDNEPATDLQASPGTSSFGGRYHPHYSDNIVSEELNSAVTAFLSNIVRFQENMYERNPIKGAAKRRYVVGFREVRKYLLLKKVKILIVAPNIEADLPNGVLDNTIQDLVSLAALSEIPYVFALSRRIFGRITLKNVPVSVIAVLDYDGTQDEFIKVLERLQIARDEYQKTQPKIVRAEDAVTNEIIDDFLNFI